MKTAIVMMLVAVLVALASAGLFMLRRGKDGRNEHSKDQRMARALALRVALSVALFLFILLSWRMGWVRPTGLPLGV